MRMRREQRLVSLRGMNISALPSRKLQEELGEQKKRRDTCQDTIQRLASTKSGIRRLPPEIIASIITILLRNVYPTLECPTYRSIRAVSKLWRRTAMSTPSLWRTLLVDLDRITTRRNRKEAKLFLNEQLDLWFSRAREGAGITLGLHGCRFGSEYKTIQSSDIMDWIQTSSFNFVALTLHDILQSFKELQALFSMSAPSLHSAKKLSIQLPPMPRTTRTIDINSTLPNLNEFRVSARGPESSPLSIFFIHSTLTSINIQCTPLRPWNVLELLRGLPSLHSVTLWCFPAEGDDEGSAGEATEPLTHYFLRDILLYDRPAGKWFNGLTCPALEHLQLWADPLVRDVVAEGLDDDSAIAFGELVQRSQVPSLTLGLDEQLPSNFLNTLLSTSGHKITTIALSSSRSLPLDGDETNPLLLPSSIKQIQCSKAMSGEDLPSWISKLVKRLEDPAKQTLNVTFGEGSTARTRRIN
ncbi:hypothetical protein BKA70DRAFT_254516 [Coprinopsis sp. MPI-PUGE-AT-0042]|nr:hypothetical protein BKA70DRAFT_254516 [Coprinopsis sp. MPI-PUGE-AT-0042]